MKSSFSLVGIILLLLIILCCCLIILLGGIGLVLSQFDGQFPVIIPSLYPSDPIPTVVVTRPPTESVPVDTLLLLEETVVPINDLRDLACRLEDKCNVPETLEPPSSPRVVGEQQVFWVTNTDTNENFQINATLQHVTAHTYFWIQDGVRYDARDLKDLAKAFEDKIYPTNREFFGSEWTPGIDGDPHIYILFARGMGFAIAGYYSAADEYHPLAHEYSNAHEMFLFSADNVGLGDEFTYGVLAHEFQHMIHWYLDRNETSWLNEGFSELAAFLNGYDIGGFDWAYITDTDMQLNDWPNDPNATMPHYGAGFLFTTYFLDRFGEEATQTLVRNPLNGMESVDDTLFQMGFTDPLTTLPITADDFFVDWIVANYIQDGSVADGRYVYHDYPNAPTASDTETIYDCPTGVSGRSVHQYGVDYIRIDCSGEFTLHFEGSTSTRLLPAYPHSGSYAYWSNKGDESDMTLTREFDFTGFSAPITLTYWTWYDLEEDYDYLYLEASTDGQHWQILITPAGTPEDPSGNSYGWGYNGVSGGWIQESVDLSQYAGQSVFLRFEYVTDAAVNGEGLLLDDIAISSVGYFSDFEADDGGWEASGFVRIQNALPQTFRLALIQQGPAGNSVQLIDINLDQTADIPLILGGDTYEAILVVSGTTRFTRELAAYQFEIR